ncbi:MAG: hypothetical protein PHX21_01015 [bacterium]|nr:hypothetical protein [bacterium]
MRDGITLLKFLVIFQSIYTIVACFFLRKYEKNVAKKSADELIKEYNKGKRKFTSFEEIVNSLPGREKRIKQLRLSTYIYIIWWAIPMTIGALYIPNKEMRTFMFLVILLMLVIAPILYFVFRLLMTQVNRIKELDAQTKYLKGEDITKFV